LLRWQWEGYERYHRSRANLLLHIVAVPLFLSGNLGLVGSLVRLEPISAVGSLACMVVSVVLQGRGHGREAEPPVPFRGPLDAVGRIFLEQWINFPRFVLTGGWTRALRASGP
jgi:hypothetical protein